MASTYCVIGSNCFTGSHFVDSLLEVGHRVIGVSRSPEYLDLLLPYKRHRRQPEFRQIDFVRDFPALQRLLEDVRPEYVIFVAALSEVALSNERPIEYYETNTLAVAKLCDLLRRSPWLKRYLHVSSAEIFGSCQGAVTETQPFRPSTPYAVSKAAADLHIETLMRNFRFDAVIARSTNVYGKHQQLFKIIPRTTIYVKSGKTIELHGGGRSVKNFIHVRDVVRGALAALERGSAGCYHFSIPSDDTVADVVRQVCELMGRDFTRSTRVVGERLGQDSRYWLDCSKSERELGWKPREDFKAGVQETIDWIEGKWDEVVRQPHDYIHGIRTGTPAGAAS